MPHNLWPWTLTDVQLKTLRGVGSLLVALQKGIAATTCVPLHLSENSQYAPPSRIVRAHALVFLSVCDPIPSPSGRPVLPCDGGPSYRVMEARLTL